MRQTMLLCQRFPTSYTNNDRSSGLGWLAALVVGLWVVRLLFAGVANAIKIEEWQVASGKKRTRSKSKSANPKYYPYL